MHELDLDVLKEMPIFGALKETTLTWLVKGARCVSLSAGSHFFREHDAASSMFVLTSGRVEILREWDGRDRLLTLMGPGDCFGEMALMECASRSATVRAASPCTALDIPLALLHELSGRDLAEFALIQMNLGREVSRRLREADKLLFLAWAKAGLLDEPFDVRAT